MRPIIVRPGFHYTANAMTTTQKQSDERVELSSFMLIALFLHEFGHCCVLIGLMETRLKYFSFIKIPGWLSAEFAETMFLLTGDLGLFDKAIGEDPMSHAIGQPRFNISHLSLSASMN